MKYKNNLTYYILKTYEVEEKARKINSSLVSKYDLYTQSLVNLKSICEKFKINTPEKLDILITNLEKEISSKEKTDEKKVKSISLVVSLFVPPIISILFDWGKTDVNFMVLVILFLVEVVIMLYAVWLIVDEINSRFSRNIQYKKLLKMLRDIKLLYCSEERKVDE